MWFLGLIIGALVGAMGGFNGAFLGALIGIFVGVVLAQRPAADEKWKRDVEDALKQLSRRVDAFERGRTAAPAAEAALQPATPVGAPTGAAMSADAASTASPVAPSVADPQVAPEVAADIPATPPSPIWAESKGGPDSGAWRRPNTTGWQVLGAVVGGVLGLFFGFGGVISGALIGWVVSLLVIAGRSDARAATGSHAPMEQTRSDAASESRAEPPATASTEETVREPEREAELVAPSSTFVDAAPSQPEDTPASWWNRLIAGNIVAKLGIVILFFGVGFLLKYAYDQGMLPVPLRLAGVALFGFGMLFAGWRLRGTRRLYGLILQGGGIGVLYLDAFFALRVYHLVDMAAGFAAFMILGVTATLLAVRQDSRILAVLGLTGAFLAPILLGSRTGNHILLFSYYTLLNGFILTISWFKAWRDLNLVGFIFTFVIGVIWGAQNYRPELFGTLEPFVLIFFAMYLVIPILFAQRQPPELKGLVDATLVFGTPLATAFMQAGLVRDLPYGLAWSAGCATLLYAILAAFTVRREGMRLLGETYIALAVVFLTLAIFFGLDAYPTFALWTLEGAAVVWVGLRQRRLLARLFGLALQLAGAFYFVIRYSDYSLGNPWFNDFTLGCTVIATSGFIIAWLMHRHRSEIAESIEPKDGILAAWAGVWWSIAGIHALHHGYPRESYITALLLFFAVSFVAIEAIGARLQWPGLRRLTAAHAPVLFLIAATLLLSQKSLAGGGFARPLAHGGYWGWPLNFAVAFWGYYRQLGAGLITAGSPRYAATWCLIAVLATWDALWLTSHRDYWGMASWGAIGIVAAGLRFWWRERGVLGATHYSGWVLGWGLIWWSGGGVGLIERHVDVGLREAAYLAFTAITFLAAEWVGRLMSWNGLRIATVAHVPALIAIMLLAHQPGTEPLGGAGLAIWPASFVVLFWALQRQRLDAVAIADGVRYWTAWLLIAVLATREFVWLLGHQEYSWALALSALVMIGGYFRFRLRERHMPDAAPLSIAILAWGAGFWFVIGLEWIDARTAAAAGVTTSLGFVAATCVLFEAAGRLGSWDVPRRATLLLVAAMVVAAFLQYRLGVHPFDSFGWAAWSVAFLGLYWSLRSQERDEIALFGGGQHVFALWLGVLVLAWELSWQLRDHGFGRAWMTLAWGIVPALAIGRIARFKDSASWPFGAHFALYRGVAMMPLAILLIAWSLYANLTHPGTTQPLPYLPVLNPLDIAQLAVLWAIWRWADTFDGEEGRAMARLAPLFAGLVFLWVNCVVLRSIHYWTGVDYTVEVLFRSVLVQSALSLLWTAMALVLMLRATRVRHRSLWIVGAVLLAVVVGKLFLLDLANSGTVERIITFIGVGLGLLAIGYLAPVPPGDQELKTG